MPLTAKKKVKANKVYRGPRGSKVKVEEISFTQLDGLPPCPKDTVRVVNYGSANGRVGRPRKGRNPFGLAI